MESPLSPRGRARVFASLGVTLLAFSSVALIPKIAASQALPAITLRQSLDAAWLLTPQSRSGDSRVAELQARDAAAGAWSPGPPSAVLAHRSDRAGSNGGLREYEAEIALPLWGRGVQAATRQQLAAEREAFAHQQAQARLKLAGEVREAAANLALALVEQGLAARKRAEAEALSLDVERRVKAGDSPRVDALQAQSAVRLAAAAVAQADAGVLKAQEAWRALTGLAAQPLLDETAAGTAGVDGIHPSVQSAQAHTRLAESKLALADKDRRDPMELGVGVTRERSAFGAASDTSLRVALRIPFATDSRNAPRIALARAELDAAQAEADAASRQVLAQVSAARAALAAARQSETLAEERASLAAQIQGLIANSYRLGNDGLPARLRAESDKSDADLALARARIESRRAVSQLNQALGLLP